MVNPINDWILIIIDPDPMKIDSDIVVFREDPYMPTSGEVVRIGNKVTDVEPGDRITFLENAVVECYIEEDGNELGLLQEKYVLLKEGK